MWFRIIAEYGDIDVTTLSNVTVRCSMTCRGTHHVMKSSRPSLLPPKNHLRIINTYGACARGGGRRPGFEASKNLRSVYRRTSKTYVRSINVRFERTFGIKTYVSNVRSMCTYGYVPATLMGMLITNTRAYVCTELEEWRLELERHANLQYFPLC